MIEKGETLDRGTTPPPSERVDTANPASEGSILPRATEAVKPEHPEGLVLGFICLGLFLVVFCIGMDRSIIATAVPKITTEFNSLEDVGWYGSSYLFTLCCFQLLFGKLYAEFNVKWVFLICLLLFEVGSVVCAAAPGSITLIIGRAIAGVGASGLATGALTILAQSLPLHKRPKYTGAISGAMGIAQIIAPLLGGVFADKLTWRWCFWINLPLGGITFAAVVFLLKLPRQTKSHAQGLTAFLEKFDLLGTAILIPCILCLLLALQWGGTTYGWNDWRIILCLCLFSILFILWGIVQFRKADRATLPLRIVRQRSMASSLWLMFCIFSTLFIIVYYVPIWLQTVKNHSAFQSGIDFLAASASMSVIIVCSGFIVGYWFLAFQNSSDTAKTSAIGYYVPQMILCSIICSIGSGLIYTFNADTSTGFWIAALIVFGTGVGIGGQLPLMAVQTVFEGTDIPLATSALIFTQTLGGTVFVSVSQNVFQSRLISDLASRVPEVNPQVVIDAGASDLVASMEKLYPEYVDAILVSYNEALQTVFLIPIILGSMSILGSAFVEWKSVKKDKVKKQESDSVELGTVTKSEGST